MNRKRWLLLPLLLTLLLGFSLSLGSVRIPFGQILTILTGGNATEPVWTEIVWNFRLTKALTCILAGGGLALAGLQMQTLFRNALAGPDVLGLSAGASLAVALIFMGQAAGIRLLYEPSPWTTALVASAGCFAVVIIMLAIAQRLRDNVSLLLVGMMISAAVSSAVGILQFVSKAEEMQIYVIWTFGSLGSLSWPEIAVLTASLTVGTLLATRSAKALNAWLLGQHYAQSLGVPVKRSRIIIILSTCILTGSVTAFCGPIGFVGLAVPHLVKLLIRTSDHKILIPASMAGGAALMLFCDVLAQLPGSTQILPINAVTALIGAPVVIWVILRHPRMHP